MSVVSFALFKKHVRSDDFSADDDYLQYLIDTAEVTVITWTNRTAKELYAMNGGEFPLMLIQAIMVLAANWYNQRESVSNTELHEAPDSLQALIKPFRKLVEDKEE